MTKPTPRHDFTGTVSTISVKYEEFKPDTYDGVCVDIGGIKHMFRGDPIVAYRAATSYAASHSDRVLELSSVDNFCADLSKDTPIDD